MPAMARMAATIWMEGRKQWSGLRGDQARASELASQQGLDHRERGCPCLSLQGAAGGGCPSALALLGGALSKLCLTRGPETGQPGVATWLSLRLWPSLRFWGPSDPNSGDGFLAITRQGDDLDCHLKHPEFCPTSSNVARDLLLCSHRPWGRPRGTAVLVPLCKPAAGLRAHP